MMRKWTLGGLAALIALCSAPAFAVTIELSAGEVVDGKVNVDAILRSEGDSVGGMQNDILFDSTAVNLARTSACSINADIGDRLDNCEEDPENITEPCKTLSRNLVNCGENATAPGCEGQPASTSRFRGIIAATAVPNNNSIPDGSVLYSCEFDVVSTPADLTNTNVVASDPFGVRLDATGTNATIGGGSTEPTFTPTAVPTPTSAPGCTAAVCVNVGTAEPVDGKATIDIVVNGDNVGGAQNDILFDSTVINLARTSACSINDAIGDRLDNCEEDPENITEPCKTLSRNFVNCGENPTAPGCEGQPANISRFRGIIAATAVPNNNSIPSGSVLYTCEFDVVNADALPAALTNVNIVASDPFGVRLDAGGDSGRVGLQDVTPIPNTPTPTHDVPPTATQVPPTATQVPPTATTVPATATATATQGVVDGFDDDDGCAIAANGNSRGWMLLIPALGLVALRRRRRA